MGLAIPKPCAASQPKRCNFFKWASVSTPSATTWRRKAPGEGDHTFDNGKVDAILQHALHETTVYLESLQRQVFKLKFLSQKGESSQ